jgi:hypothetical protein
MNAIAPMAGALSAINTGERATEQEQDDLCGGYGTPAQDAEFCRGL